VPGVEGTGPLLTPGAGGPLEAALPTETLSAGLGGAFAGSTAAVAEALGSAVFPAGLVLEGRGSPALDSECGVQALDAATQANSKTRGNKRKQERGTTDNRNLQGAQENIGPEITYLLLLALLNSHTTHTKPSQSKCAFQDRTSRLLRVSGRVTSKAVGVTRKHGVSRLANAIPQLDQER
jgi:hypothetical protein